MRLRLNKFRQSAHHLNSHVHTHIYNTHTTQQISPICAYLRLSAHHTHTHVHKYKYNTHHTTKFAQSEPVSVCVQKMHTPFFVCSCGFFCVALHFVCLSLRNFCLSRNQLSLLRIAIEPLFLMLSATRCNTLQHAATRCNSLQLAATCCEMLYHAATRQDIPSLFFSLNPLDF